MMVTASNAGEGRYIAVAPGGDDYKGVYILDTSTGNLRYCSIEFSETTSQPPKCSDWLEE
jgi:hypothetical protein